MNSSVMLTSVQARYFALRSFFRHHGWVADMPKNYGHYVGMMAELVGGRVVLPSTTPEGCRRTDSTYECTVMIGSSTCCTVPYMTEDGYFIIQGQEKVVLIQEVRLQTEPCVTLGKLPGIVCCELFVNGATVPARVRISDDSVVDLETQMIHKDVRGIKSVGVHEVIVSIFSSGLASSPEGRAEVYQKVFYMLRSYCAEHADACMVYIVSSSRGIGGLSIDEDRETIRSKMFGGMSDNGIIATLVTMVVACVLVKLGFAPLSDRDDYSMKCLKSPGETMYKIFRYCFNTCKSSKSLRSTVERQMHSFIKRGEITLGGRVYNKMSMQLSKRSHVDELSCVRKVVVPCDENSPNIKMRQIHESQKGYICPCETPEGKTVGITKSLACCCIISTKTDISPWTSEFCSDDIFPGCTWVIVDGAVAGWCKNGDVSGIKTVYPTVSVTMTKRNVARIRTSSGRPLRPLLVTRNHPVDWGRIQDFSTMLSLGELEYLDPAECANNVIASVGYSGDWRKFTHMEIHPCTMLGLAASMIPFPEHNQSARNVFSSSMIKQAMQMHGREKTCDYLQKPLVRTVIGRSMDDDPNGVNVVVYIMSINGYNQEDAIIVKKSSADRGLFSSVARNLASATVDNPWNVVNTDNPGAAGSAAKAKELHVLHGGTEKTLVTIGAMMSLPRVTGVKDCVTDNGRSKIDVTIVEHRCLQLGDKLASRHAQKGVVGLLMNDVDMPFTSGGVVPDIIINPHAIPSRMTVGQLMEGAMGKRSAVSGAFGDGTPFLRSNMGDLRNMLDIDETEVVTLGTTGEEVHTPIAIGLVYYMALKHQATDKVYVRSSGPKSIMSRQPISGRSKGGGLRFGEMEYDCLIAHGASKLVTRVSENSDMVNAPYCSTCSVVTDVFDGPCRLCGSHTVLRRIPFSYAVFKDLMLAANIQVHTEL